MQHGGRSRRSAIKILFHQSRLVNHGNGLFETRRRLYHADFICMGIVGWHKSRKMCIEVPDHNVPIKIGDFLLGLTTSLA